MLTANQPAKTEPTTQEPMTIRVYNTLTNRKETFEPVTPGKVGVYLCGPTVYKPSHIGHMVGPVIFDCITRHLRYSGYEVTLVINVTDVDDKLIAESMQRGMTMAALADEMTADYMNNLQAMGVDTVDHFPRATDSMQAIIEFIQALIDQGFAYEAEGDVYFDVAKDPGYGKLSNRSVEDMQIEGGEMAGRKRSLADFALWKGAKKGEPSWESAWGPGRPGWHIECSVMSHAILGETFDIHGGGLDLVFPHHENEIAQSECRHGGKPQAKYWMHNGLMQSADQVGKLGGRETREADADANAGDQQAQEAGKMGKSKGAGAFSELLGRHAPEAIRLLLLSTHYRSPILFSEDEIEKSAERLETFYRFFKRYQRVTGEDFYALQAAQTRTAGEFDPGEDALLKELHGQRERFLQRMDDDFNTAGAIGNLFETVTALNRFVETEKLEGEAKGRADAIAVLQRGSAVLREMGNILGLFRQSVEESSGGDLVVGQLMELLIELRAEARKQKNFATADRIRDGLTEIGVTLEDRADGTDWTVQR